MLKYRVDLLAARFIYFPTNSLMLHALHARGIKVVRKNFRFSYEHETNIDTIAINVCLIHVTKFFQHPADQSNNAIINDSVYSLVHDTEYRLLTSGLSVHCPRQFLKRINSLNS